jgi:hypothetical protein
MRIRGTVPKGLLVSLIITLVPITAFSAQEITPGSNCKVLNQKVVYQNKTYTCIKSGKRLVWNKGVVVKKATPTPTIQPIKSFSELKTRYLDFHFLAWDSAFNAISKTASTGLEIESRLGPNSRMCEKNSKVALENVQKMYSGSLLPKKIWIIYFDENDRNWAESETKKLLRQNEIQISNGKMNNPESVNVATQEAVVWFENSCLMTDFMSISGAGMSHGYTHSIQKFQFSKNPEKWGTWGSIPRWLLEGGATFSENITAYGESYLKWKNAEPFHNKDLKKYDLAFYEDFLRFKLPGTTPYSWEYTNKWPTQRVYDIGSLVCEILVSIKGPNSIMDLYSEFALSQDFDASFKKIFGVTWSEASPDVALAVYQFVQHTF